MSALTFFLSFFFNDTATTEIYTLSLHDALPIYPGRGGRSHRAAAPRGAARPGGPTVDPPGRARRPDAHAGRAGRRRAAPYTARRRAVRPLAGGARLRCFRALLRGSWTRSATRAT